MIKILHVVQAFQSGGVEFLLYNYYSNMNRDNIHFDFLVISSETGLIEKKIESYGSKIYHLQENLSLSQLYKEGESFFRVHKGEYDIIHCHIDMQSAIFLKLAKKYQIRVRITQVHNIAIADNLKRKMINRLGAVMIKHYATDLFACGRKAGEMRYGKEKDFYIVSNAVDTAKFCFSKQNRRELREKFNVSENTVVFGHIGRMSKQKNQFFIIDVFEKYYEKNQNSVLFFIGGGKLKEELVNYAKHKQCCEQIKFVGEVDNVNCFLSMFDCFLLPSLYEGFPVVLVETQSAGLMSFVSEEVSKEVALTKNVKFLPITNTEGWVSEMKGFVNDNTEKNDLYRIESNQIMRQSKYEIKNAARVLYDKYVSLISKS